MTTPAGEQGAEDPMERLAETGQLEAAGACVRCGTVALRNGLFSSTAKRVAQEVLDLRAELSSERLSRARAEEERDRDKARLDWMESCGTNFHFNRWGFVGVNGDVTLRKFPKLQSECVHLGEEPNHSIRDAIDAYMTAAVPATNPRSE